MPSGIYIRTEKHLEALKNRKIPLRTPEWNAHIGDALRKGQNKTCLCGKNFYVHRYRLKTINYCSLKCANKWILRGLTKGKKIPNGSLAKIGEKNPMFGKHLSELHKKKQSISLKKYWDKKGRRTIEYKRIQKLSLEYKRRAKIKGSFTHKEWETLKKQYNFTCPCCKKSEPEIKLTIDHIIPISKGGLNTIENLQPLCLKCNCKKNNRHNTKYEIL